MRSLARALAATALALAAAHAAQAAATPRRAFRDLAYARASEQQRLDLYTPNLAPRPLPLIVLLHGGGFSAGDKSDGTLDPVAEEALARGYAVARVNYRLSTQARFPAQIADVKVAVRFLRGRARTYGLDPTRFAAWGVSAGGFLAALLGTTADVAALDDPPAALADVSPAVQAVIVWCAPIDLLALDPQMRENKAGPANHGEAQSAESVLMGAPLATIAERVRAANPEAYVSADDPPFLLEHGTADATIPVEQSRHFAAALGAGRAELRELPRVAHAGPAFTEPENLAAVFDFLGRRMTGK